MKTILPILLLATATLHAANKNDSYLNFVIQIQNNSNQTTHKIDDVSPIGNGTALRGVTTSSVFQLWTINRTTAAEHLLDEKTVSSYHPEASITISSDDPYASVPRTRVDHPFEVSYTVNGLITNDPNVQDAAKAVVLDHTTTEYAEGLYTPEGGSSVIHPQAEITENGTTQESLYTQIEAADLTTVRGEEVFTIYAKPDFGVADASMLARAKVQIWPIAQGSISGINSTESYARLPSLTINCVDLYPSSTTYVRIYKGTPSATPTDAVEINTSYIIIDEDAPQNRSFLLSNLDSFIPDPGNYTVEIIHETPFGADILSQVYPLNKKGSIKVVGSLNDSE